MNTNLYARNDTSSLEVLIFFHSLGAHFSWQTGVTHRHLFVTDRGVPTRLKPRLWHKVRKCSFFVTNRQTQMVCMVLDRKTNRQTMRCHYIQIVTKRVDQVQKGERCLKPNQQQWQNITSWREAPTQLWEHQGGTCPRDATVEAMFWWKLEDIGDNF